VKLCAAAQALSVMASFVRWKLNDPTSKWSLIVSVSLMTAVAAIALYSVSVKGMVSVVLVAVSLSRGIALAIQVLQESLCQNFFAANSPEKPVTWTIPVKIS